MTSTQSPADRLAAAFAGDPTDRVPVMPKIWFTLAARMQGIELPQILADPEAAMRCVVEAARSVESDGARLFLSPSRHTRWKDDRLVEVDGTGRVLGTIDLEGGLGTKLERPEDFLPESPQCVAFHTSWTAELPLIRDASEAARLAVPDKTFFEQAGYAERVQRVRRDYGGSVGLAGDCDSATLAFCVSLRGMHQALMDLIDDPQLVHALTNKGEACAIERGKFFIDQGVRILRLNDSVANMSVISPSQWRQFVKSPIRRVCAALHAYCPDVKIYCHICGRILPILEDLLDAGLDCIAPLDTLGGFTVADVRRVVGDDVVLMGGVDTFAFVHDTPPQMIARARRCIEDGNRNGRYILGSGCALPADAQIENIRALADASRMASQC